MKNPFEKLSKKNPNESSKNTEWDNLNAIEFAGNTETINPEKAKAERQQRKITAYLLYGKNTEYINSPDVRLNPGDQDRLIEQLTDGTITIDDERELISKLKGPIQKFGTEKIFADIQPDKHSLRILGYYTGLSQKANTPEERLTNAKNGFDNFTPLANPVNFKSFATNFPTPIEFEAESATLLESLEKTQSPAKYQEYVRDIEAFKHRIYGKRQEYWEQIKALENQAAKRQQQKSAENPMNTGERAETLIKDFGYYEMSRAQAKAGMIANNPGERLPQDYTEDAHLEMPEQGLFAVFDGAGGTNNENGGARIASQTAAAKIQELATRYNLENPGNLAWALNEASKAIESDPRAGLSTGTIAKIVEQNGAKKLAFATVGDSRIYIVRQKSLTIPITKDEGEGKYITNALGRINNQDSSNRTKQLGLVDLWPGDRIVLCTDGITGDKPEELMSESQIAHIVGLAWNANQAAAELVETAKKKDDRTAIVFQI